MVQQGLVRDIYNILDQVNTEDIPADLKLPDSFSQLVSEMKNNQYDAKTFAIVLRAMVRCVSSKPYCFYVEISKLLSLLKRKERIINTPILDFVMICFHFLIF